MSKVLIFVFLTIFCAIIFYFIFRKPKRRNYFPNVLITGASSGLGEALAYYLSEKGCKIILVSRNRDKLIQINERINPTDKAHKYVVQLDISLLEEVVAAASHIKTNFPPVDVIINSAGVGIRGSCESTSLTVYSTLMNVNYFGPICLIKEFLPEMIKRKRGHIISISSIQGYIGVRMRSAYAASKAAINLFMDCLRTEVTQDGINVTSISPSHIRTNFSINALTQQGKGHNIMDENTAKGMDPYYVAERVYECIISQEDEVILAPLKYRIAVLLRFIFPALVMWASERYDKRKKLE